MIYVAKTLCLLLVGVGAFCVSMETCHYLVTLGAATEALPRIAQQEIAETRSVMRSEIVATRTEALAAVARLQATADKRLGSIQSDAVRAAERVDARLGEVTATVAGLRSDVRPVLANAESITRHADESAAILFRRDALPAQLLGTLGAAKVTLGETAQTMREVKRISPKIADATLANAQNIAGITGDVHTITERFSRPKSIWGRIGDALKTTAFIAAHFL